MHDEFIKTNNCHSVRCGELWHLLPSPNVLVAVSKRHVGHKHTHLFNGSFSGTTQVSRYQKGKTNLDFTGARDSEWQWHQLGHMQVCTLLQTDNHASTPPLSFLQAGCPSCRPTNSVKALKAICGPQNWAKTKSRQKHLCKSCMSFNSHFTSQPDTGNVCDYTHTQTHPFNGPLSGTTWVSRYQKGKTNLDFTEARDSEWQWHQLGRVQVRTSLQTDTGR